MRRALGLSAERRKSIYAALGESAEAGGDLEGAEQAYWRAASIEAEPTLRANYLVAHARMLMARGDVQTAFSELDAALARAPDHAGAAAVLADLCYRTHDWTRARALYTALETAPDAADVIPRELLVHRRAALAHRQGDAAEAEALYRELAILNPSQAEARRALAELSRARGDLPAAAQRLEEVLRLVPGEGTGDLLETRYRLASIYARDGRVGFGALPPGAGRRPGSVEGGAAGAAARSLRSPQHSRSGRGSLCAPRPAAPRADPARGGPLPPGRAAAHAAR